MLTGLDHVSQTHVGNESNLDLYASPPSYAQSVASDEHSLDVNAAQPEKPPRTQNPEFNANDNSSLHNGLNSHPVSRGTIQLLYAGPNHDALHTSQSTDLPPDYFTELTNNAATAHVKRCSLLRERPATWLVKNKGLALCPLSATILMREGVLRQKDLELVSRSSGVKRDPTDPLSAVAFGVYDTVGDILLGLVQGPVELGRQQGHYKPVPTPDASSEADQEKASLLSTPSKDKAAISLAAKQVAIGTGKGLGRIVGAGVKAPMTFSHGLTRGFHNMPKLYGEEVREYENVVDFRSGLRVSRKGFVHGIADGLKDFFVKPMEGAQKDGLVGLGKGMGRGIGNLVCKNTAGVIGIVGYSSAGVYKEFQSMGFGKKDAAVDVAVRLGEAEYEQASDQLRRDIVKKWCDAIMRGT
ncbi:hypothetical protein CC80DRAFT_422782 [Byssothecium circinans]|uniref:Glycosyltransferase family 1 protein n=1 Tax=Byssothecium circinans TaxID=147558 RepID=A0A6A5THU4_9PLEO|nr:hypothetical protein CC80DRAFT_422782 [Byssothecium circinans]